MEASSGGLRVRMAVGSDVGRRYRDNFDVWHVGVAPPCAVVADGMGDGPGSAAAGRITMAAFVDAISAPGAVGPAGLRAAVATIQSRVNVEGRRLGELTGCTLSALVLDDTGGWIVQVGDSRVYRLRDGLLELLTVDHTAAWLGAVYGWYPADSPQAAAARYRLTRYIGHPGHPEPDIMHVAPRPGDVFCVCTDGVAEQLSYELLGRRLGAGSDPAAIVDAIVADARQAGGSDNATAAVVCFRN
ncbi:protein phosphatase [Virgisporangium aliadipatigenens]|uniref:Protein phosphatase n=1 Tax=Virgisporangium aliadipatigenens TaxID=741659 RepID=A0A8J3YJI0_9ACTN|nr:protein phosphatase [Virgisporangium aliadipatigenens]